MRDPCCASLTSLSSLENYINPHQSSRRKQEYHFQGRKYTLQTLFRVSEIKFEMLKMIGSSPNRQLCNDYISSNNQTSKYMLNTEKGIHRTAKHNR